MSMCSKFEWRYLLRMQFEDLFLPYSRYCVEQAVCINYIRQQQRDNELFAAFLAVSY